MRSLGGRTRYAPQHRSVGAAAMNTTLPLPTAAEDPRKAAVLSGAALVVRGLLAVIRDYSCGPTSSPVVEFELGNRLIEAGQSLRHYGRAVRAGQVGRVGARQQ
jgi:hypothetical protein